MSKEEKGRHCSSCNKTVVDMREMSWDEIIKLKQKSNEFICGAYNSQQATEMQKGSIFPGVRFGRKAMLTLLSTGAFYASGQDLQFTPEIETDTIQEQKTTGVSTAPKIVKLKKYNFQVLDSSTNKPVELITVKLMDAPGGDYSDTNGFVTLMVPDTIANPHIRLTMLGVSDTVEIDMNTKVVYFDMDQVKVTIRSHTLGMIIRQDHDKIETRKDILDSSQKLNSSD